MYMAVSNSRLPKEVSISSIHALPSAIETAPAAQSQINSVNIGMQSVLAMTPHGSARECVERATSRRHSFKDNFSKVPHRSRSLAIHASCDTRMRVL